MLRKRAHQVTEGDLYDLVQGGATEDERLEFKRDMYGDSDAERREMIHDIVSMANLRGGLILIGIEEDTDGKACAVPGVPGGRHDERIMSSAQANVDPRISSLNVAVVPLENGRSVVAIDIPESLSAPHMATFQGENTFWMRHGRQKGKMTVDEVQGAFLRRIQSGSLVEDFLEQRRLPENLELSDGRILMLQASPLLPRDDLFDVSDPEIIQLLRSAPRHQQLQTSCSDGTPRPSLHGRRVESPEWTDWTEYLELWRQGYMEFASAHVEEDGAINSFTILGLVYSFVHLYRRLLEVSGLGAPVLLAMSIHRAATSSLHVPESLRIRTRHVPNTWSKPCIKVPTVYVDDIGTEADRVVRHLNDRLWNAFGFESCLPLREDGEVIVR